MLKSGSLRVMPHRQDVSGRFRGIRGIAVLKRRLPAIGVLAEASAESRTQRGFCETTMLGVAFAVAPVVVAPFPS